MGQEYWECVFDAMDEVSFRIKVALILVLVASLVLLASCSNSTPTTPPHAQTRSNSIEVSSVELDKDTWKVSITCCLNAGSRNEALRQASALIMAYSKEVPAAKEPPKMPAEAPAETVQK